MQVVNQPTAPGERAARRDGPRGLSKLGSETFYLYQNDNVKEIEINSGNLYEGEIEDMADAILNNKPPRISLADSRNNVRTILNLLESAKPSAPV